MIHESLNSSDYTLAKQTPSEQTSFVAESGISMAVLGSGSRGNAAVVRCGSTHILVDAGLNAKQLVLRMNKLGIVPEQLDAILISHEHHDHAQGIDVLLRQRDIPVFANALTHEALSHKMKSSIAWKIFHSGQAFSLGELSINSFRISHDAAEPVGFVLNGNRAFSRHRCGRIYQGRIRPGRAQRVSYQCAPRWL